MKVHQRDEDGNELLPSNYGHFRFRQIRDGSKTLKIKVKVEIK